MAKITQVTPGAGYVLTVRLDNNSVVSIDLKKKLRTVRFSELRDKEVFKGAKTDGKMVYWPGGLSIDVDEILEIANK